MSSGKAHPPRGFNFQFIPNTNDDHVVERPSNKKKIYLLLLSIWVGKGSKVYRVIRNLLFFFSIFINDLI